MTLDEERQERREHLVSRCDMSIEDIKSEIDFILGQPKHEWVGLDEDRVAYLADKYAPPIDPAFTKDDDYWRFYQEIELELKEKNT